MTPQEKLRWFWSMGEVPGTIFDDLNDQAPSASGHSRRRQAKRLQVGSRKRHKETSIRDGSPIGLEQSD